MSNSDPRRAFAEQVVTQLQHAGFQALWAGGCVRDHLIGKTPKDYDIATDARPEQVRSVFGHRRTLAVGESFGVIVVLPARKEAGQIEVATFRTDGLYVDGRRPESVEFSTPELDAQRRDFTINGMFYDPVKQRVLDFVGGEHDLAAGIIRAIGDPHARMEEDKLRLLRAVRFTATFEFQLDADTAAAVRAMASELVVVSAERIAQELRRMLVDPHRHRALALCQDLGLLPYALPALVPTASNPESWQLTLSMLRLLQAPSFSLAYAVLFACEVERDAGSVGRSEAAELAVVEQAGKDLRLSNREIDDALWLLRHRHALNGARELSLARRKRTLAHPLAHDLLALMRVRDLASGHEPADSIFCEEFLRTTPPEEINPPPLLCGNDLIQAGIPPGPRFKLLLDLVRDAQLNGEINSFDAALNLARKHTLLD